MEKTKKGVVPSIAKGRKKQYVQKITTKDKEMLRAFRNCGLLSPEQLKKGLGVSEKRVLNFKRDGYLEKVHLLNPRTLKMDAVYRLSNKGRDLVESQLNLQYCYRSSGGIHDLEVTERYLLLKDTERLTWKTEGELRSLFHTHVQKQDITKSLELQIAWEDKLISSTDGAYTSVDGQTIAVEIVTRNYNTAAVKAKVRFAEVLAMEIEITQI